jgi:hypothetical protein
MGRELALALLVHRMKESMFWVNSPASWKKCHSRWAKTVQKMMSFALALALLSGETETRSPSGSRMITSHHDITAVVLLLLLLADEAIQDSKMIPR